MPGNIARRGIQNAKCCMAIASVTAGMVTEAPSKALREPRGAAEESNFLVGGPADARRLGRSLPGYAFPAIGGAP